MIARRRQSFFRKPVAVFYLLYSRITAHKVHPFACKDDVTGKFHHRILSCCLSSHKLLHFCSGSVIRSNTFRIVLYILIVFNGFPSVYSEGVKGEKNGETVTAENTEDLTKLKTKELFQRGQDHFFAGRYNTALEVFLIVVEKDPENAAAHSYCGDIYLLQKKYNEAVRHFRVAAELSAESQKEYFRLGQAHYLAKNAGESVKALDRSMQIQESFPPPYFYRALVELNLNQKPKEAAGWFRKYLEVFPESGQKPQLEKAIALLESPDYGKNKEEDKSALEDLTGSPPASAPVSVPESREPVKIDLSESSLPEDDKEIIAAMAIDRQMWKAAYNVGLIRIRNRQLNEAAALLQEALKVCEEKTCNSEAFAALHAANADALLLQKKPLPAKEQYLKSLSYDPADTTTRFNLALAHKEAGEKELYKEQLIEVRKRKKDHLRAGMELSQHYEKEKQPSEALRVLENLGASHPVNKQILLRVTRLYLAEDRLLSAKLGMEKLSSLYKEDPEVLALQGDLYLKDGDEENAVKSYENSLSQGFSMAIAEKLLKYYQTKNDTENTERIRSAIFANPAEIDPAGDLADDYIQHTLKKGPEYKKDFFAFLIAYLQQKSADPQVKNLIQPLLSDPVFIKEAGTETIAEITKLMQPKPKPGPGPESEKAPETENKPNSDGNDPQPEETGTD